ncbi:MAG TPA: N-methyl-L-tryptophan oxidase [Nocardioides sp.]|uniref:N-methyl-L-tryptophan oxidase n=1 Tax=Nocardioides sp. TaxID=35761 RepID=UPI002E3625E0|nr:N-methyl-L-tryptophan oxidase [Nocardioides sp.]HEX3931562.1 N-methyl-L-tryptophan oxidase [Nocardioides sp.]
MEVDYVVVGLGALGSGAAWQLATRGHSVVGLEQFELGHARGASHDTSRILRHSYHTPAYVRLTEEAYDDWARLEAESGESLVTVVGGLDLFPADCVISPVDYVESLREVGIAFEELDVDEIRRRWPVFHPPAGTRGLYQERGAIVPAARGTAAMQRLAADAGATLLGSTPVSRVLDHGSHVEVVAGDTSYACRGVVVAADAWTNQVLSGLGVEIPLTVTLEQPTYFAPPDPAPYQDMPLWIWMDEPSYYGFPCYGEPTVKAAQDCGGPVVDPDDRTSEPDPEMRDRLAAFMGSLLPGTGEVVRSLRCQYTLTPDRDFVMSAVPGHASVVVGLGSAHGFKFAPTFGRILADLVTTGQTTSDVAGFGFDRPGLTDPAYEANWMV